MILNVPLNAQNAIREASIKTGVDEKLLTGFAYIETDFGRNTLSKTGVKGLFQITGATWERVRRKNNATLGYSEDYNEQAYTAALLIKSLLKRYDNDYYLTAIAYNAGEGVADAVKRHGKTKEAIVAAVQAQRAKGGEAAIGFGYGKEKEVITYPQKLEQALGAPITIDASVPPIANFRDQSVTGSAKEAEYKYDPDKPFIANLFGANANKIAESSKITDASIKDSKLVSRIKAGIAKQKHDRSKVAQWLHL
jgi:hypothetical protein